MTTTERDWTELFRGETKHIDYKGTMTWEGGRESLLKHVIAMSNIRDGGRIVIGVGENATTKAHEARGLSDEELHSFDPTKVAQYVNGFVQPGVKVGVARHEIEGKRVILLEVAEFDHTPNICVKAGPGASPLFKAGDVLIRTDAPESRRIQTAEEMRELLRLALGKTTENLLRDMRRIVEGRDIEVQPEDRHADLLASWSKEVGEFAERLIEKHHRQSVSLFDFRVVPLEPVEPIDDHEQLKRMYQQSTVNLGGYDPFPSSIQYETPYNRDGFVEGVETLEGYEHEWRAYFDGPFLHAEIVQEWTLDPDRFPRVKGKRFLKYNRVCDKVALGFVFAGRFLDRRGYSGPVRIEFRWTDTSGRGLLYEDPWMWNPDSYECREPQVRGSVTLSTVDLKAGWESMAAPELKKMFGLFQSKATVAVIEDRLRRFARGQIS